MERTPGTSSSLCVRAKNRQILVRIQRSADLQSHPRICTFGSRTVHERFANHSVRLCVRGFIDLLHGAVSRYTITLKIYGATFVDIE